MITLDGVARAKAENSSVLARKRNLLMFFIVVTLVSVSPMSIAGTTLWDISASVFFRGSGGGPINLNADGTASQIRIVDGVVEFTSLIIGANTISLIGFNASSNANVTVVGFGSDRITFNIEANNGVTTTTVVKAPPDTTVTSATGADTFSFDGGTDLATVTEVHGAATKQIILWFNPVSGSFATTIRALVDILVLVALILGVVLAAEVSRGNFFTGTTMTLTSFIVGTGIVIMILRIAEAIFN